MLDFEFVKPSFEHSEGYVMIRLSHESADYYNQNQFPLYFIIKSLSGQVIWNSELRPGTWSTFSPISCTEIEVIDSLGNQILKWNWHPFVHGDLCHQKFYIWALNNRGTNGLAIGTHNGMTGEWVVPVNKGLLKATLVEASEPQYNDLKKYYNAKKWVHCKQALVTSHGKKTIFFEGLTDGQTNSISETNIRFHLSENLITQSLRDSISVNQLILETSLRGKVDWIHLDLEGVDGEIIYSIDKSLLPKMLLFESLHMSPQYNEELCDYLRNQNYSVVKSNWNTICIKID